MNLSWSFNRIWCQLSLVVVLLCGTHASCQPGAPGRRVQGDVLSSQHDPRIRITVPSSAHYVGADRWILGGFDDCELYAFVDANQHKIVRRLYWIQFESYLP